MCGIAGVLDFRAELTAEQLDAGVRAMAATLAHRGPDDGGCWTKVSAGIGLGHRRLSIIDLSPLGHQPMHSSCGRFVVSFNGEIYNYRELRSELAELGATFRGTSDTEVLLAAVVAWGVEGALRRFDGMFAFALWDNQQAELYLARDRAGEKPLYYCVAPGETFLFGSEMKALRAHPAFQAEIDRDSLVLFLRYGYVPSPHSIYRSVLSLPPGHFLRVTPRVGGRLPTPEHYWSIREVAEKGLRAPFRGSDEELVAHLDRLLRQAVSRRMYADVPLGAFLSGGIDSSTVVALMQAESSSPVFTFSIGLPESELDEARFAKKVAAHLGTNHHELCVTAREACDVIRLLPTMYDVPFADSSQIPTYLVSRFARQHVTVALTGDAGDELFGGYVRHRWLQDIWKTTRWMGLTGRKFAAGLLGQFSARQWDDIYALVCPVLPARMRERSVGQKLHKLAAILGATNAETMYHGLVSICKDPLRIVLGAKATETPLTDPNLRLEHCSLTDQIMYLDTLTYLPDDILVKVDRASMYVSLEARVPFLDQQVIDFAWSIPASKRIRGGTTKWPLRQVLKRYVPPSLYERPKAGFGVPLKEWLRGPLRTWAEELLSPHRLRQEGYFDAQSVANVWREHVDGTKDREFELWTILMFQAWLDRQGSDKPASGHVPVLTGCAQSLP